MKPAVGRDESERMEWAEAGPLLLMHFAALGGLASGAKPVDFWVSVALFCSRMLFITAGYHRYFAHRGYRLSRVAQFLMALGGTLAAQKGPLWWAGNHRYHHRFSDQPQDVHSPRRGFFWSHVGWLLCRKHNPTRVAMMRDFAGFAELRLLNRYWALPPTALAIGLYLWGGWSMLFVGFFLSTILLYHATFAVNSLTHLFGRRRYATGDDSRNSLLLALVTFGEGWHNNHHHFPTAARNGFFWWEIDFAYYAIRALSWLGLASDLRVPSRRLLARNLLADDRRRVREPASGATVLVAALAVLSTWACGQSAPPDRPGAYREGNPANGEKALMAGNYGEPLWRESSYWSIWKRWGVAAKPPDFEAEVLRRYGLHPAPYANDGLPMGLRRTREKRKGETGLTWDCMVCHGGSIGGRSYVGLGNTTLDMKALNDDLNAVDSSPNLREPFELTVVRGLNNSDALASYLLSLRNADLSWSVIAYFTNTNPDLGWAHMVHVDTPPWWNWRNKSWLYYDGFADARSHASQTFLLLGLFRKPFGNDLRPEYESWRDVRAYIQARVEAPAYPFPLERQRARRGAAVYASGAARCAECHGSYEGFDPPRLAEYETSITPLSKLGTDPLRYETLTDTFIDKYNSVDWFSSAYKARRKDERVAGYVAPPLTGIWATAPYLHNGSVPTLADLLSPVEQRPARYYRYPTTAREAYDPEKVGWKIVSCPTGGCAGASLPYPRMIYDTSQRGLGNVGHLYGLDLPAADKRDLIEFLKAL
ncbi:MAG TPA: acyl-CoA desaturase [Vicinamibacteria bacterium]